MKKFLLSTFCLVLLPFVFPSASYGLTDPAGPCPTDTFKGQITAIGTSASPIKALAEAGSRIAAEAIFAIKKQAKWSDSVRCNATLVWHGDKDVVTECVYSWGMYTCTTTITEGYTWIPNDP